jgi:hydrogenase-4 component E
MHPLGVGDALAGTVAVSLLAVQLGLLRSVVLDELITIYAVQSFLVTVVCAAVAVIEGAWDLGVLAALTFAFKVVGLPIYMRSLTRGISSRVELPQRVNVALSLIIAAGLMGVAILTASGLPLRTGAFAPRADIAATLAIVFTGFLVAILRPNALAQVVAFLTLENGLFFGTVTLAPGIPFVIGVLLLIDVLVAVLVFAVLVRVLVAQRASASLHVFESLRG